MAGTFANCDPPGDAARRHVRDFHPEFMIPAVTDRYASRSFVVDLVKVRIETEVGEPRTEGDRTVITIRTLIWIGEGEDAG